MNRLKDYRGDCSSIKVVEMGVEDVERSAVVSKILDIYRDPEPLVSETPVVTDPIPFHNTIKLSIII